MARLTNGIAAAEGTELLRRRASQGRLNAGMACDTAFRIIARRHLDAVITQHDGTCSGDPEALHKIRIAVTHLRTAIRFFAPMVDDAIRREVWRELKWFNSQLGIVRDLDVAIERIFAASGNQLAVMAQLRCWKEKVSESHRLLSRALQSTRYRNLIERTSSWIEGGPWSTKRSKGAVKLRSRSLAEHAADRLKIWEKALLKKSLKLPELGVKRRHKLRLLNKRLTYSIESLSDLFAGATLGRQRAVLKQLRKAQRSLGQLNDDARGRALAKSLNGPGSNASFHFLDRGREKRLVRAAVAAYGKLKKSKPFRISDLTHSAHADG